LNKNGKMQRRNVKERILPLLSFLTNKVVWTPRGGPLIVARQPSECGKSFKSVASSLSVSILNLFLLVSGYSA
jgi:hypothetical protein